MHPSSSRPRSHITRRPSRPIRSPWTRANRLIAGSTLVAGLFVAACGSGAAIDESVSAGTADAAPLTLALPTAGPLPNVGFIPVGVGRGYFKGHGVDLQIQYLQGAAAISAVQAGQADVVLTSPDPLIAANAQGGDLESIYQVASQSVFSYGFIEGSLVTGLAQFATAKIGVVATGNIPASLTYINYDLALAGQPPITTANLVAVGEGSSAVAAIQSNQVDALFLTDSGLQTIESAGTKLDIEPIASLETGFPGLALMAKRSVVKEKAQALEGFLAGFALSTIWCTAEPEQCMQALLQNAPSAAPDQQSALDQWTVRAKLYQPTTGTNLGRNDPDAWTLAMEVQKKVGTQGADLDPTTLYTNDLLGQVTATG